MSEGPPVLAKHGLSIVPQMLKTNLPEEWVGSSVEGTDTSVDGTLVEKISCEADPTGEPEKETPSCLKEKRESKLTPLPEPTVWKGSSP